MTPTEQVAFVRQLLPQVEILDRRLQLAAQDQLCRFVTTKRQIPCARCGGKGTRSGGYQGGDILECDKTEPYTGPCHLAGRLGVENMCRWCQAVQYAHRCLVALTGFVQCAEEERRRAEIAVSSRREELDDAETRVTAARRELQAAETELERLTARNDAGAK